MLGDGVIIGRRRNNNKVHITVGTLVIQRCGQIQFILGKVLFYIFILNRKLFIVN